MYEWIQEHNKVLSVLISFGTLLIWLVYAQLLYSGYRRQVRPRIVINRGKHRDLNALCIISNMSAEAVFVEHILARLETSEGTVLEDVTELEQEYEQGDEQKDQRDSPSTSLSESTRQGPLNSGDFLHIGSFQEVIRRTLRDQRLERGDDEAEPVRLKSLTIQVLAIYGSDDMPIGVERRFLIEHVENGHRLVPATWDSRRMAGRLDRRRMRKMMESLRREQLAGDQ
ncbi:hypothetical protein LL252_09135 [Alcanivorax marinus]|uniref:Uncharacterized protein n=1 Tax=Alloalcanivorax marinus TaxID=1177169 RepID=A0A9Q3UM35_9GAMM|nr:hypothetical protein [Alloalcanivorax marinus]MCC4308735.1 hypothetical protein [Alloalcanivorax marinus]MCU5788457.1 hypothetical protein [Alloalcanivorax marinus]